MLVWKLSHNHDGRDEIRYNVFVEKSTTQIAKKLDRVITELQKVISVCINLQTLGSSQLLDPYYGSIKQMAS